MGTYTAAILPVASPQLEEGGAKCTMSSKSCSSEQGDHRMIESEYPELKGTHKEH